MQNRKRVQESRQHTLRFVTLNSTESRKTKISSENQFNDALTVNAINRLSSAALSKIENYNIFNIILS